MIFFQQILVETEESRNNIFLLLLHFIRQLDWRPEKKDGAARMRHERIVIIRNMFHPKDFEVGICYYRLYAIIGNIELPAKSPQ